MKRSFSSSSSHVDIAIWMHNMDANKTYREKAWRQLHKNAASNMEQVLKAAPNKKQLYGHLPPITKTIQVRRTRYARHCRRSGVKLISEILKWTCSHGRAKTGWPARTYIYSMPIQDVVLETYRERWTIETGGKRGSGRSVLAAWHDDDDDFQPKSQYYESSWVTLLVLYCNGNKNPFIFNDSYSVTENIQTIDLIFIVTHTMLWPICSSVCFCINQDAVNSRNISSDKD